MISKKYNFIAYFGLIISYLFVEWIYNQHLLMLLSIDKINPNSFYYTEVFGKSIASFGINLILLNFYNAYKKIKFIIGFILGYIFLSIFFNLAINSFSNEIRHSSYYSMMYREQIINLKDKDKILLFSQDKAWYEKSIILSQFFYTLNDNKWISLKEDLQKPLLKEINRLNDNKNSYYVEYLQYMNSYNSIMEQWGKYVYAQSLYKYNNKNISAFEKKYNIKADLTFLEFIEIKFPKFVSISNKLIFKGNKEANVDDIKIKDIPLHMNKDKFYSFIESKSNDIKLKIAPDVSNITLNVKSFDSLAILIIPPISIILSLFSILINSTILICKTISIFIEKKNHIKVYVIGFAILFAMLFSFILKNDILNESSYWLNLKNNNSNIFTKVLSFSLKIEPILCTNQKNSFIKKYTDLIYN